ncbi:MAG: hypothetical protein IPG04_38455 [Polyangiaceae bacterium]|nr:hypothetical protein [Polyangiaceae bacterium]
MRLCTLAGAGAGAGVGDELLELLDLLALVVLLLDARSGEIWLLAMIISSCCQVDDDRLVVDVRDEQVQISFKWRSWEMVTSTPS